MPTYSDPDLDPVAWRARMGEPEPIHGDDDMLDADEAAKEIEGLVKARRITRQEADRVEGGDDA